MKQTLTVQKVKIPSYEAHTYIYFMTCTQ